jgi:nucleotide-binding universal stress UspA family protein
VALAPRGYAEGGRPLDRVVVGYDGGVESGLALKVAAELASLAGVGLRVVVVAGPPSAFMTPTTIDLAEVVERSAHEHAEQLVAEGAGRVTAAIAVERDIVRGEPGSALASAARAGRVLLVVGSRRYGPVRSVLVGTVGHHLAHSATCPVLIVPRGVETGRAGEVLAASTARD